MKKSGQGVNKYGNSIALSGGRRSPSPVVLLPVPFFLPYSFHPATFILLKNHCYSLALMTSINKALHFFLLLRRLWRHLICPVCLDISSLFFHGITTSRPFPYRLFFPRLTSLNDVVPGMMWSLALWCSLLYPRHVLHNTRFSPSCDCLSLLSFPQLCELKPPVATTTGLRVTNVRKTDRTQ